MTIASKLDWAATAFTKALSIQYPIIQAPCAGHTGPELIAAVCNAGGLGSLGAGMIPATQLRTIIQDIKRKTDKPFAVNLFCRPATPPTQEELQKHYPKTDDVLNDIRAELGLPIPTEYKLRSPPLEDQVNVLLEEKVPVVSFTFGLLPNSVLHKFWSSGTYVIGTATTVQEALLLAGLSSSDPTRKADAIVAQGLEAGGHRGSFLKGESNDPSCQQKPTGELVLAIQAAFANKSHSNTIPVLAAGGISSGSDVRRALYDWKADGAIIGTLFMMANESTTPKAHKEYMMKAKTEGLDDTIITETITGKSVRSYPNKLMKRISEAGGEIPSYDVHSSKTKDIGAFAIEKGLSDYMLLLSGANAAAAAEFSEKGTLSAAQIIKKLVAEVNN